jgi:hypothetical protein
MDRKSLNIEQAVFCFATAKHLEEAADYAARGRRFKDLPHMELVDAWKAAFIRMVSNRRDPATTALVGDLHGEFRLRGQEPPFELLADQEEQLRRVFVASFAKLEKEVPGITAIINQRLEREIDDYFAERDKSEN